MSTIQEIVMWLIVGALLVLVVTHSVGFSRDVSTVGTEGNKVLGTLSGAGQSAGT